MDIAIIGLALETPAATTPEALWEIVASGRSLTRPFPPQRRQDVDEYARFVKRTHCGPVDDAPVDYYRASYLDRIDQFDHEFFGMTQRQAAITDPHQRLVLRTMYRALEDAGYVGPRVAGSRTGVFVGFAANPMNSYGDYCGRIDPSMTQLGITGNIQTMLANRLSYLFDLRGPSMVVDSACSASLVAVHLARTALLADDCDMAVVAGTRIVLAPVDHAMTRIGIESSDGATHTFDESADGTGLGEGSAVLVLKRLDRALADRDHIHAVIKGSAVNHDGHSEGLTSPDAESQARLLTQAWQRAGVDPRTIGYVEAHGTATRIGDPIEVDGLTRAFRTVTDERGFCAVGTVKSNLGHLFEGSGALAMAKTVLMLKNRQLPPVAGFREPNPRIDFASSPVRVPAELEEWHPRDGVRRCGVSAFGLGGTNAHVVLEEHTRPEPSADSRPEGPFLFTLSARTERSLRLTARALARRLERGDLDGDLADVCYTSNIARSHHAHRLALVADDLTSLAEHLLRAANGTTDDADDPLPGQESPERATTAALGAAWKAGEDVDLTSQFTGRGGDLPSTVPLAPYVFDETRAWVEFPSDWETRLNVAGGEPAQSGAFEISFVPVPPSAPAPATSASVLALVDPGNPATSLLAAALPGVRLVTVDAADDAAALAARLVDAAEEAEATRLVFALPFEEKPAEDLTEFDRRVEKNVVGLFLLARELMNRAARVSLTVLTRNALTVSPGHGGVIPENAALAGLVKTLGQEYPTFRARLVDVDDATAPGTVGAELLGTEPGVFVVREGVVHGEFFSEITEFATSCPAPAPYLRPGGAYLLTGGTGGLGLAVARRFAEQCPGIALYLLSRSGLPPRDRWEELAFGGEDSPAAEQARCVLELEALGASVRGLAADAGDEDALRTAVEEIRSRHGRLDGIVHGAGVPPENLVMFRETADFRRVLRAKMRGTFVLDRLTRDDPPAFVVLMSSVASVIPGLGQADYAAANAYLDAVATASADARCHVLAVNWVAWRDTGMALTTGTNEDSIFKALPTATGLDLLDTGLRTDHRRFLAGHINYESELVALLPEHQMRISDEINVRIEHAAVASSARFEQTVAQARAAIEAVVVELTGRPEGNYSDLELTVGRCLAQATGSSRLPIDVDLRDIGIDSLGVLAVTTNLGACLGRDIDPVSLFSGGTIAGIAANLEVPDDDFG
ncbi:MAG: hypothetical protein QG622_3762, partial [Actinomycetota bacterium]|nr:hypothetical protein [Actinomycetota bacterium]